MNDTKAKEYLIGKWNLVDKDYDIKQLIFHLEFSEKNVKLQQEQNGEKVNIDARWIFHYHGTENKGKLLIENLVFILEYVDEDQLILKENLTNSNNPCLFEYKRI